MLFYHSVMIRWCVFLSLSLVFMRCGRSDLSTGVVTDPSLLQVSIVVHRRVCYDGNSGSIKAYLKDQSGKAVANHTIQIHVNGQPLRLNNGSSNYYGAFPYYELVSDSVESVSGGETYAFTMVLSDGKVYEIGSLQTHADLTTEQFSVPAVHDRRQPLALHWQKVEPDNYWSALWKRWHGETAHSQITVSKVNETTDQWGNKIEEQGSPDQADYISIDVGSGSGDYTVPVDYLKNATYPFNTLSLLLTSIRTVKIDGSFQTGSDITSEHSTFYRISVTN